MRKLGALVASGVLLIAGAGCDLEVKGLDEVINGAMNGAGIDLSKLDLAGLIQQVQQLIGCPYAS